MFSKTADKSRSWSLAARLSAWYAVSTFLLLVLAVGLLSLTLLNSFDDEDERSVQEKVNVLRSLLRDRFHNTDVIHWEVHEESSVRPGARVFSRIMAPDGVILFESEDMAAALPIGLLPRPRENAKGFELTVGGTPYRVASVLFEQGYAVQVALDLSNEENLLSGYRRLLWIVLAVGLIASVFIGYRIGRGGIRPVTEMAATVQNIRSANLAERMETAGLPRELSALAATFNQMLDRLEDAFSRLSVFSSDIAHELRTPVNNLRLDAEVALSKTRRPEEYREVIEASMEEFQRLSRLIDSLLFLARSENPRTQIQREDLPLARELAAIREFYEAPASEAGIALEVDVAPGLHAMVDRTLFQRAAGNLIENALAHTPSGGVIRISAAQRDGSVEVGIADTGEGIPREQLGHVFIRFYRVDPARSRHAGGLGLGLAIVKSIATLHGGSVEIESALGKGTAVRLVFPTQPQSNSASMVT